MAFAIGPLAPLRAKSSTISQTGRNEAAAVTNVGYTALGTFGAGPGVPLQTNLATSISAALGQLEGRCDHSRILSSTALN